MMFYPLAEYIQQRSTKSITETSSDIDRNIKHNRLFASNIIILIFHLFNLQLVSHNSKLKCKIQTIHNNQ